MCCSSCFTSHESSTRVSDRWLQQEVSLAVFGRIAVVLDHRRQLNLAQPRESDVGDKKQGESRDVVMLRRYCGVAVDMP